eukprot:Amastigsp_a513609_11.p1 type:complete len:215 gc:universal Amastigsp_a513609_11:94-738(+)
MSGHPSGASVEGLGKCRTYAVQRAGRNPSRPALPRNFSCLLGGTRHTAAGGNVARSFDVHLAGRAAIAARQVVLDAAVSLGCHTAHCVFRAVSAVAGCVGSITCNIFHLVAGALDRVAGLLGSAFDRAVAIHAGIAVRVDRSTGAGAGTHIAADVAVHAATNADTCIGVGTRAGGCRTCAGIHADTCTNADTHLGVCGKSQRGRQGHSGGKGTH